MDTTGKIAVGSTVGVAVIVGSIFALLWPRRSYAFQRNLSWKKTITDGEELYADIQDLKGKAKSYINEYKTLDLNDQKAVGEYKARLETDVIGRFKSVGKKLDLSTWDKYNVRPYILGVGNVMSELSRLPQVKRSSPSVEKKKEGFGPSSLAEQLADDEYKTEYPSFPSGEELYADIQDLKGKVKSYINEYKTLDLNDQKAVGKYKARLKTDVIDPFKSVGKKLDLSTWDKYNVRPYILGVGNVMSELSRLPQVKRSSPSVEKKKEGFGPSSLAEQLKRRKAELMKGRGRKTTKQGRKLSLAEQIKTQRAKLKKAGSRKTRTRKKQTVLEKRREAMKGKYSSGEDDGDFSSSDF